MKKIKLGQGLMAVAALALIGGPVTAAVWSAAAQDVTTSSVSSAQLTAQLKAAIVETTTALAGQTAGDSASAAYTSALEGVIVSSGASPEVVAAALEAALAELQAEGALPRAAASAIYATLTRVRAEIQSGPAATGGDTGLPAFGATPTSSAGGGGPDYGTAA